MRVLIQNCLNQKFLSPAGNWVVENTKARNFEKTLRAWAQIDELRLSGVRIVLNFGEKVDSIQVGTPNSAASAAC